MMDVVAETSPVFAERTRLPRLRSLVGGGATVGLVALVALVAPHVGTSASAPGHTPVLQLPDVPGVASHPDAFELDALNAMRHTTVAHKIVTHKVAKDPAVPAAPSLRTYAGAPVAHAAQAPSTSNETHVVSNVQGVAPANANKNTQMNANSVSVTSASKHVNSNRSVNVSNSTVQKVTSGQVKQSTHVSSSTKVSRTHTNSQTAP